MTAARSFSTDALIRALPAVTLFIYLVMTEPPAALLLFFGAVATHEWGHLVAFRLIGVKAPPLSLAGVGARLSPTVPLLPKEEFRVAISGPLANLLFAFLALRFGRGDFFLLFAVIHLLFGVCNLLPFGLTDGERVLNILISFVFPRHAKAVSCAISTLFLALFFYFSLFLRFLTGNGLCGVFFSLFFLLEEKNPPANVF